MDKKDPICSNENCCPINGYIMVFTDHLTVTAVVQHFFTAYNTQYVAGISVDFVLLSIREETLQFFTISENERRSDIEGLSQILCKRRNAVQIEQNLFKAEVAQAAAALFSK